MENKSKGLPLNFEAQYVAMELDRRKHGETIKKDPNDPRSIEELRELPLKEYFDATSYRNFQTEAWIRGEEYPAAGKIAMPEPGEHLLMDCLLAHEIW